MASGSKVFKLIRNYYCSTKFIASTSKKNLELQTKLHFLFPLYSYWPSTDTLVEIKILNMHVSLYVDIFLAHFLKHILTDEQL